MSLNFHINRSGFIGIIVILLLILAVMIFCAENFDNILFENFLFSCKICSVAILLSWIVLLLVQDRLVNINSISYTFFILFQFGVPLLYAIHSNYYNYYTSLFDEKILNNSLIYTTLCILFWCIGSVISSSGCSNKKYDIVFSKLPIMEKRDLLKKALILIIIVSGLIVIPLYTYCAFITLQEGFSQEIRKILVSNAVFRFGGAFFLPSCLLYRCYSSEIYLKFFRSIDLLFIYICVLSLLIGDRTTGICWLIVLLYDIYNEDVKVSNSIKSFISLISAFLILGMISVIIAINRISTVDQQIGFFSMGLFSVVEHIIEELGFNFYSIAFVNIYVPSLHDYELGFSYLNSLLSLIPNSFDVLNIKQNLLENPVQWLLAANHSEFGSLLDFGVGFSFIAETYLNFSWFGCVVAFIFPLFLRNIFGLYFISNGWERYVRLIFLYMLIMFPRRAIVESFITFEYAILFLGGYLIIVDKVVSRSFSFINK